MAINRGFFSARGVRGRQGAPTTSCNGDAQGMSGKILVVDDDMVSRAAVCMMLREEGYVVTEAVDGKTALEYFYKDPPDLVLLDVVMPEPDGFEVCQRLKDDPETRLTPVVLLTGLDSTTDRVQGIEAGADEFLSKPVQGIELIARVRSLLNLKHFTDDLERAEDIILALALAIEGRDPYTKGHCERLSSYASRLAERIGLTSEHIEACRVGGFVHDIGKIIVPDAVLLKSSNLTAEEWDVMRQHAPRGEEICKGLKSFKDVLPIIRHHHEKRDGSGYPDGLSGDDIPINARVLQVVDVFDALRTNRPYKKAHSIESSLSILREEVEKGWWDPEIAGPFIAMIEEESAA